MQGMYYSSTTRKHGASSALSLSLSLEKPQAHPGRGPSNHAWELRAHVCLYKKEGEKHHQGQDRSVASIRVPQRFELRLRSLSPPAATVHLHAVDVMHAQQFIVMKSSMRYARPYYETDVMSVRRV